MSLVHLSIQSLNKLKCIQRFREVFFLCFVIVIAQQSLQAQACVGGIANNENMTLPAGFSNFMILSSETSFNAPSFNSAPPGSNFDTNIMARIPAEVDAQKLKAVTFFNNYYGVDFSSSDTSPDGKWLLVHLSIPSEYNQRIVYSGDQTVVTNGWQVHQGFYRMASILTEVNHTLYGVWGGITGKTVLAGTFADFGEMRIKIPCVTSGFQDLDLNYESLRPTYPDIMASALGATKGYQGSRANIDYAVSLESDSNINGSIRGRLELKNLGGDNYSAQVRAVIKLD